LPFPKCRDAVTAKEISMSPRKEKKGIGRGPIPRALSPGAESEVMTLQEVAEYLHCAYSTVHKLIRQRQIPSFKLGGGWRFLKSEIDQWISDRQIKPEDAEQTLSLKGRRPKARP
jgi:excisionase family DNA binding protein